MNLAKALRLATISPSLYRLDRNSLRIFLVALLYLQIEYSTTKKPIATPITTG
jgi:hypothetical protein